MHRHEVVKGPSGYKRVGAKSQKTLTLETLGLIEPVVHAQKSPVSDQKKTQLSFKKTQLSFSQAETDWRARLGLVDP